MGDCWIIGSKHGGGWIIGLVLKLGVPELNRLSVVCSRQKNEPGSDVRLR